MRLFIDLIHLFTIFLSTHVSAKVKCQPVTVWIVKSRGRSSYYNCQTFLSSVNFCVRCVCGKEGKSILNCTIEISVDDFVTILQLK